LSQPMSLLAARAGLATQPNLVPANQLPMSPPPRPDPNLCWDRSPTWVRAWIPRARPGQKVRVAIDDTRAS
jgi:hypothetical protein